jgi:hypothetical protein
VFAAVFVPEGLDPELINSAFESESILFLPLLFFNICQFLAWIITGIVIFKTKLAPIWVGMALILRVPVLITAQAFYFNLEIFWPLANALWAVGIWGLIRTQKTMSG